MHPRQLILTSITGCSSWYSRRPPAWAPCAARHGACCTCLRGRQLIAVGTCSSSSATLHTTNSRARRPMRALSMAMCCAWTARTTATMISPPKCWTRFGGRWCTGDLTFSSKRMMTRTSARVTWSSFWTNALVPALTWERPAQKARPHSAPTSASRFTVNGLGEDQVCRGTTRTTLPSSTLRSTQTSCREEGTSSRTAQPALSLTWGRRWDSTRGDVKQNGCRIKRTCSWRSC
mmetsp:Transcript_27132/g.86363  ORF Transcript_27132/g.86363 Transcript_27132/m.86363 type:complete len:233 (+) Transcript_27132:1483-2181(+)